MCFHFHIGRCLTGCHSSPNFFLPARAASLQFFRNFHTSESSFSLGALLTAQICSPLPQDSAQKSWSHVNHISIKLEKKRREENRREKKDECYVGNHQCLLYPLKKLVGTVFTAALFTVART